MPNYKNISNNSYLHHLLRRYNSENWIYSEDNGGTFLIPAGVGNDGIVITRGASYFYRYLFDLLQKPDTKRWLFDSDQAIEFSRLGINPAQEDGSETISPFPQFYMEFTDPLTGVVEQEPGYQDATVALLFRENVVALTNEQLLVDIQGPDITLSSATFFLQSFFEGGNMDNLYNTVIRLDNPDGKMHVDDSKDSTYYTDRTFKMHLSTGQAWVTPMMTTKAVHDGSDKQWKNREKEVSEKWLKEGEKENFGTDWMANQEAIGRANKEWKTAASWSANNDYAESDTTTGATSEVPEEWLEIDNMTKYYPAGAVIKGMEDRRIGYWEQITQQYCDMFIWILMYIQSKQIIITEMLPQRSERRRLQKKGEVPQPWHILQINPKLYVNLNQNGEGATGTAHGHRYDVRAHWRRQTIKYGPGRTLTKRVTQYVPSHMRGLQNEVYVPKTRKVEK